MHCCLLLLVLTTQSRETIDIAQRYGNVTDVTINMGIGAARKIFATDPNAVVELFIEAGTHVIHEVCTMFIYCIRGVVSLLICKGCGIYVYIAAK